MIKFLVVALCFVIALISYRYSYSKRDWAFLVVGMGFTVISDYFLVLRHNYPMGVFTFCFVHIAYILRVSINREKSLMFVFAAIGSGVLFYGIFSFLPFLNTLVLVAGIYATLFVLDLIHHAKFCRHGGENNLPKLNRYIMMLGLILFALCDIHVLIFNLPNHIPSFPAELAARSENQIWLYYIPSQILLAISAVHWKKITK